jgi:hypothetical protein
MALRFKKWVCAVVLICFLAGCTKTVRVPAEEITKLEPSNQKYLDVTTSDARFRVTRFSVNDTTLVVEAVETSTSSYPSRNTQFDAPPYLPYPLPLSSIESVEQLEHPSNASGAFIVLAIAGSLVVALVLVASHMDWGSGN